MNTAGWETWRLVGKWAFASLFMVGGVAHLVVPDVYLKIMPPSLPFPRALVIVSGLIETALGVLLLAPATSRLAAWGLIALLIAVFPANVYMYRHPEMFSFPPLALLLRLPIQGVLILWAYAYTRR